MIIKKRFFISIVLFLIISLIAPSAILASQSNSISVEFNEMNVLTGVSTVRIKGLTFVPLRPIMEALGGTLQWDGSKKTIIIKRGKTTLRLNPGKSQVYINGIEHELVPLVQVSGGVMMVPYYFFYLTLNIETEWSPKEKRLVLKMKNSQVKKSIVRGEYGDLVEMDHPLIKRDSQIMVPAKKLFSSIFGEYLDSSLYLHLGHLKVDYNEAFQASFQAGDNIMKFNGYDLTMPTTAYLYNEELYLPLEFIAGLLYEEIKEVGSDYVTIQSMTIHDMSEVYRFWNVQELKYEGERLNGKAHGKGKVTFDALNWYEGDFVDGTIQGMGAFYRNGYLYYEGEVRNGVPNGTGVVYQVDVPEPHKWFEGSFVDGKMHGYIKEYLLNRFEKTTQLYFEGEFRNNQKNGTGKFYQSGSIDFEGQFKNGLRNGYGIQYHHSGIPIYKGEYKDDLRDGQGTVILNLYHADREMKYEGQFSKGLPTGVGTLWKKSDNDQYVEFSDGTELLLIDEKYVYIGRVERGMANGKGILYEYLSRVIYEGQFLDNKYHGEGTYYDISEQKQGTHTLFSYARFVGNFESGSLNYGQKYIEQLISDRLVYEGQLSQYKPHGQGKELDGFGNVIYEGKFENGVKSGRGVQYSTIGIKSFEGTYKDDELLYGRAYRADGEILFEGTFVEEDYFEGTMRFVNGYRYEGRIEDEEFPDGIFYDPLNQVIHMGANGSPDRFFVDGSIFYGQLEMGEGTGTLHMVDGMKYSGEFFVLPSGEGKIYRSDGSLLYEGTVSPFYNEAIWALPDGDGKFYSPQGKVIADGTFEVGFYKLQLQHDKKSDISKALKEFEQSITFIPTKDKPWTYEIEIKDGAYYKKFSEMELSLRVDLIEQYLIENEYWIEGSAISIHIYHNDVPVMLTLFEKGSVYSLIIPGYWVNSLWK